MMMATITNELSGGTVVYEAPDSGVRVEVRLEQDTVWLSMIQIVELFERDKSVISRHLRNIIEYFNLDAILSVGHRVNLQSAAFKPYNWPTL